jgi:hypothetical protein
VDKNEERPGIGQEAVAKIVGVYWQMKTRNFCLRHFDNRAQIHLRLGRRWILVSDQPYGDAQRINLFPDLHHFLLFALKHFKRILHSYKSFGGGLKKLGNIAP